MSESLTITVDGLDLVIPVRRNKRARRIILRIGRDGQSAIMTMPFGVALAEGEAMALRHTGWLQKRLGGHRPFCAFEPGLTIPFRGEETLLVQGPVRPRTIVYADGAIHVGGDPDFFARRLVEWLRAEARSQATKVAHQKAALIGKKPGKITIRDQKTRWGSCSSNGNLSFSWRLILAPPHVFDYVVSHEVAHLNHMNHSSAFWATVHNLEVDVRKSKNWLNTYGEKLHRYGVRT